jgi:hypothetical protein
VQRRQVHPARQHAGERDHQQRRQREQHPRRQLDGQVPVGRQRRGAQLADPAAGALGRHAGAAGRQGRAHGAVGGHRHQQVAGQGEPAVALPAVVDVAEQQVDAQREGDREQHEAAVTQHAEQLEAQVGEHRISSWWDRCRGPFRRRRNWSR